MINVRLIENENLKEEVCNDILRKLPNWFGIEESIVEYTMDSKDMIFYGAYDKDIPIGFVALKIHNEYTAEVYVMGILEKYHRSGIGTNLIEKCTSYCKDKNMEFLTVKTLDSSHTDKGYEKTRKFYKSMGFKPLEVFKDLWGEANPCLYMAKVIR